MNKLLFWIALSVLIISCERITEKSNLTIAFLSNSELPASSVNCIYKASNGSLWLGTNQGLVEFNEDKWTRYSKENYWLTDNQISSLSQFEDILLIGTLGDGVNRLWITNVDAVTGASSYDTVWSGITSKRIHCIMVDSTKAQWFGTQKGVSIHEGSQTRTGWTKFTTPDGLVDNYITAIAADHSGRYWIGTRNGLSVYSNNNFMNYSENTALQDQMINDIVFAGDGTGWLATSSGLISLNIDGTEPVWSESGVLKGSGVFALLFDSYETLWVGTSNNMYTFNNGSRIYENDLVEFDGLKVNDICETNPSEIYVATDKGVYKINMKQN